MKKTPASAPRAAATSTGKASAAAAPKAAPKGASKPRALVDKAAVNAAANGDGIEDIRDAVSRLKRERIIATAIEQFDKHGLNNTTLDAVAEKMNVTKAFIYSHFKSKNELLGEICARGIRSSLEVLDRVVATEATLVDKVETMVREFMLAVLRNQASIAIYTREEKHLSEADRAAINDLRREFDRKLRAFLEEGVANGDFQVEDVQLAALAIGGIVSWSYVWYRPSGRLSSEETAARVARMVLAMLGAKPARRKRG